jgi:predicted permease
MSERIMKRILKMWRGLMFFIRRDQMDQDLAEEMQLHLEMKAKEKRQAGMDEKEAQQAAIREFGNPLLLKEVSRDMWGWNRVESIMKDIRYGLRLLAKNPGFTAVAVLTLALGIGANTAVFSVVDAVLLRPLPYQHPEQLLLISETLPQMSHDEIGVSAAEYYDYREQTHSFSQVAAYESDGFNLTGEGAPLRVNAARLSASAFPLLGVGASLGRTFTPEEDRVGFANVVVLSHSLWERQYSRDPKILGKTVKLDEKPYIVVGVMPASFCFPFDGAPFSERADLWLPEAFSLNRLKDRTMEFGVGLIGRLKPGVTEAQAQKDVENIAAAFMHQHPEAYGGTVWVAPRVYSLATNTIRRAKPLVILLEAFVFCVLLIACANVANLLLARASRRGREMAIRSAIGAGRAQLLRQCLVESLLLSLLGAASGILLAMALVVGIRHFGPADLPRLQDVTLHSLTLGFTLLLSLVTSLIFGFIPAVRLSQVSPQACLKESNQLGPTRGNQRLQNCMVVGEIGVALALLISGSLLLRSFLHVLDVPLGFQPKGVLVARTIFDGARYPEPMKREAVQKELIHRLSHLPGITVVAAASHLPLSDARKIGFRLEHAAPDDFHWAENSLVSPGYFRALGISILRGRDFTEQDRKDSPGVAVISETMARQYFPGNDPIGQRFHWGDRWLFRIIGVAADVHIAALDADPPPMIYHSMFQVESGASDRTALVIRSGLSDDRAEQGIFQAVQQQVWSLDKDLPLYNTTTLATLVSESVAQRRFTMVLMGGFAVMALLLAVIGLFGVVSFLVAERERELAVRMALGAERAGICWMVLKRGAALGLAGCAIGLTLFAVGAQLLQENLFQVSSFDPLTLTLTPTLLLGVAMLAAYWPARRAMRLDPMAALRYE